MHHNGPRSTLPTKLIVISRIQDRHAADMQFFQRAQVSGSMTDQFDYTTRDEPLVAGGAFVDYASSLVLHPMAALPKGLPVCVYVCMYVCIYTSRLETKNMPSYMTEVHVGCWLAYHY